MNVGQLSLPPRTHLVSLLGFGSGGAASLAASANVPCSRERRNAGLAIASRRGELRTMTAARLVSPTTGAFGASHRLRGRFALREPGKSQSERQTPNQALQRTAGFGGQFTRAALIRPAQSRAVLPAMKPGTARAFASRRCAATRAPGPQSLSYGSLGVATRSP